MEWYIEVSENKLFKRMTSREELALEIASAKGQSTVEYTWKFQSDFAEFAGDEVPVGTRYVLGGTSTGVAPITVIVSMGMCKVASPRGSMGDDTTALWAMITKCPNAALLPDILKSTLSNDIVTYDNI